MPLQTLAASSAPKTTRLSHRCGTRANFVRIAPKNRRRRGCASHLLPLRYTSKMSSPLSQLRTILRILNKWPSTRPRDSIWKTYLREEYRRSAADPAALDALRRRARDYANLLDGVEEQKRLRALDTGAEVSEGVKEAIRRSAARSGLVAPDDVDAPFVDLNKERNG